MTEEINGSRRESDQRLARFEGVLEGVVGRLAIMESKIDKLAQGRLLEARTNWAPIIAGVAVVVALIGIMANGYARDQSRMEATFRNDLKRLEEKQTQHDELASDHMGDGHPVWVNERIKSVGDRALLLRSDLKALTTVVYNHNEMDAREMAMVLERCGK